MTKLEWLNYAQENRVKLESLLTNWHPCSPRMGHDMKITASAAERACETVRKQIATKQYDAVQIFRTSLDIDDVEAINILLNEAWFGVPESTSCWNIDGFTEAVRLMENLPDEC